MRYLNNIHHTIRKTVHIKFICKMKFKIYVNCMYNEMFLFKPENK